MMIHFFAEGPAPGRRVRPDVFAALARPVPHPDDAHWIGDPLAVKRRQLAELRESLIRRLIGGLGAVLVVLAVGSALAASVAGSVLAGVVGGLAAADAVGVVVIWSTRHDWRRFRQLRDEIQLLEWARG